MAPRRNISFRPTIFNDLVATIGFKLFIAHSKRLNYTYQVVKVYFCATIIEYLDNVVLKKKTNRCYEFNRLPASGSED